MEPKDGHDAALTEIFAAFNEAWTRYWESYTRLQDSLYESLRAGREVAWLAATDEEKLREINQVQRELFSRMPRRLDYAPLGEVTQDLGSSRSKIADLQEALSREEQGCRDLEAAITLMKEKIDAMEKALTSANA